MAHHRRDLLVAAGALLGGGVTGTASGGRWRRHAGAAAGTGQQGGYGPLGSVDVPGARDAAVAGEVAYVAAGDGFAVVDVSDPGQPEVLAQRRTVETDTEQSLLGIWDVWPWEDRLVVAGPAGFRPGQPTGFAVFDVSDPADPQQVAFHPSGNYIHNTYVTDGVVYLTGRDPGMSVVMVDVTDDDPVEVGRWSPLDVDDRWTEVEPPLRTLHDVYVHEGTAYLPYWDAGTWIVDVSDPGDPTARGRVADYTFEQLAAVPPEQAGRVARTPRGGHHYAAVDEDGTVLLVGRETWSFDDASGLFGEAGRRVGGASGITLYDVSDPADPDRLSTVDPPDSFDQTTGGWFTTAHNADIRDGRLYSSWYFGGVAVHDVSDPANPAELARWHRPRETCFWTAQAGGNDMFVASSTDLSSVFGGATETREALYVFPDEAGSQADPPSLTDWPEDVFGPEPDDRPDVDWAGGSVSNVVDVPGGDEGDDSPDDTGTDGSGDDTDGATDGTADDTTDAGGDTDDDSENGSDGTDGAGPGLGVGATLAGLGGYLLARRAGLLSGSRGE